MIRRILMYIILILGAFMLQNNFFAAVHWIDITPNLLLIVTFEFGFLRGSMHGMIIGFFCGLLSDFFFGTNVGYYALIYTLIGYANGSVGTLFYNEFLNMPTLLCILSDLLLGLYVYITSFLIGGATNLWHYMLHVILPEIVYTMLICLLTYKPLRALDRWVEGLSKRSAKEFV
ncbi:MAG: rod shape-determining protein MreD [Lachnospiraceae bacterium]|nr:rod shape-determining protein MreD [Lachnospiraceae bacterium]